MEIKQYVDEVIDFNNKEQLEHINKLLKWKQRIIFDRKFFSGDVLVRPDWRTRLLTRCLEYIINEQSNKEK